MDALEIREVAGVLGQGVEALLRGAGEDRDRVLGDALVELWIDTGEEIAGALVPRPPKVLGQGGERAELRGDARLDLVAVDLHGAGLRRPRRAGNLSLGCANPVFGEDVE